MILGFFNSISLTMADRELGKLMIRIRNNPEAREDFRGHILL